MVLPLLVIHLGETSAAPSDGKCATEYLENGIAIEPKKKKKGPRRMQIAPVMSPPFPGKEKLIPELPEGSVALVVR